MSHPNPTHIGPNLEVHAQGQKVCDTVMKLQKGKAVCRKQKYLSKRKYSPQKYKIATERSL